MITVKSAGAEEYTDFCRGDKTHSNECPGYDNNPFDGETHVLEIWEIWVIASLPFLPGPLRPGVGEPVTVPTMG